MKNIQIYSLFLAMLIGIPVVYSSIGILMMDNDEYDLVEITEVEGIDEKEMDEEEIDHVNFTFDNQIDLISNKIISSEYFSQNKLTIGYSTDVLTPPPKSV